MPTSITDCHFIELPRVPDPHGNLTFIENGRHIPFAVQRVFYLYDVPTNSDRRAHAHKTLHQFLICLNGSFDVSVDDGKESTIFHLNRPWRGLYIPPMIWLSEINFDPRSICLVLASAPYLESDYYRDYVQFVSAKRNERNE